MQKDETREQLRTLLRGQRLGVLATSQGGQPYGSLVAYAATPDLSALLFATPRATRKFANLAANPRVSLVVDDRGAGESDFHMASVVTAVGSVTEVDTGEDPAVLDVYLEKHPYLRTFVASPTCALFRLSVQRYHLASRFQTVNEFRLDL